MLQAFRMIPAMLAIPVMPTGHGAASQPAVSIVGVLGALFAVLVVDLALFYVWSVRRLILEKPTFRPTWSYVDLWWAAQLILAAILFAVLPFAWFLPGTFGGDNLVSNPAIILPLTLLQNVIFWAVPAAFLVFKYRLPLREIGLRALPRRRDLAIGIPLGLAAIPLSGALEAALNWAVKPFSNLPFFAWGRSIDTSLPITQLIAGVAQHGWWAIALAFLVVGPATGIGEEMLFRGFLFNLLKRRIGVWPGIVLSSLVFALVHGYFIGAIPVFLLGGALAVTYQRTGSLWTNILFHATNNGLAVLLACYFPGLAH